MSNRKIISDPVDEFFTKPSLKSKDNILLLSGGGTSQTCFSMGAVGCLVDNGLFYKNGKLKFDVISAVSGGSILLLLLDLCTNPIYNYYKEKNWYNRYVRQNLYTMMKLKPFAYLINSRFNFIKLQDYIFKNIPDFSRDMTSENTNQKCEYYYINGYTNKISCDNTDIIDIKNQVKVPLWYLIQTCRCGVPFTYLNGKPTYDCGNIEQMPLTGVFTKYKPKRIVCVDRALNLEYNQYPTTNLLKLGMNWLFNDMYTSDNEINKLVSLLMIENDRNIICSMSNELNRSKDKFHNDLFQDFSLDYSTPIKLYTGILFEHENGMKILENEGYIQMYECLKRTGEAKVFNIPNPDVYNRHVKTTMEDLKNKNIVLGILKELITTPVFPF